ncbi:hypothetical protein ACSLO9_33025, partial [Escherichia coli]
MGAFALGYIALNRGEQINALWIVVVLGYFQVVWPLNRQPVPLPKDMSLWPSVDIFVPT